MEKNTYDQSIMETESCINRNKSIDIAKGLLILCVVIGHGTQNQSLSDFMYRFHMPLFLILSGCFLKRIEDVETYAKMKAVRLLVPYLIYMTIDFLANYVQTECQFRYCGTAIPFLTVRSTAR